MKKLIFLMSLVVSLGTQAFAKDTIGLEGITGNYTLEAGQSDCGTEQVTITVDESVITLKTVGHYTFSSQPYDVTYTYSDVNANKVETTEYPNAVVEIKRTVFSKNRLMTQSKKRSVLFPTPWILIPWKAQTELTVLNANEIMVEAGCRMLRD